MVACLFMIPFLIPLPKGNPVLNQLFDLSHVVVFAIVALLFGITFSQRPLWQSILLSFVSILAIGLFIEIVQPFVGRRASMKDLKYDAIGGLIGITIAVIIRLAVRCLYPRKDRDQNAAGLH